MSDQLEIGTIVPELLKSIRTQADVLTALSSGGLGLVLFKIVGIERGQVHIPPRRRILLFLSVASFVVAAVSGFVTTSYITGFWTETVSKEEARLAIAYLAEDPLLKIASRLASTQIFASVVGVVSAAFYIWLNRQK